MGSIVFPYHRRVSSWSEMIVAELQDDLECRRLSLCRHGSGREFRILEDNAYRQLRVSQELTNLL